MNLGRLPVLWICGAPGVGKSVTAWELFQRSDDAGYLDIDQTGMLYPEDEADGDGHLLEQRALEALRANYSMAGAHTLLVSGVVDPDLVVDSQAPVPREDVCYCLLTVDPDVLRRRILARGWEAADADEAVEEQAALVSAGFADLVVETTGRSVSEVADMVASVLTPTPGTGTGRAGSPAVDDQPTVPAIFVTGPRVVGCSTVGFTLARRSWDRGTRTGFADLGQLSFLRRPGVDGHTDLALGLANLDSLRAVFARLGAERFVANGHLAARPTPDTTLVRLRADADTLRAHIDSRLGGTEARLTGDDLAEATPAYQEQVLEKAVADQEQLERTGLGDLVVDVMGRSVDDVVGEVERYAVGVGP